MQAQPQYGAASSMPAAGGPATTVHMLILSSQVGRAIDKGGSVIKQVEALCDNSVQIQVLHLIDLVRCLIELVLHVFDLVHAVSN